jgi:predicted Co/Zn/Cd cation transporter (cation efflux family)
VTLSGPLAAKFADGRRPVSACMLLLPHHALLMLACVSQLALSCASILGQGRQLWAKVLVRVLALLAVGGLRDC